MKFNLRPAKKEDAPQIRRLVRRSGINPFGLKWPRFVVAEDEGGQFLGCAQLKPHRDGSLELASLAVVERCRGLGIARALIEHWLAEGPRPLFLMCRAELGPLYEKFGFQSAAAEGLPPHFRRLRRLFDLAGSFSRRERGLIMRLD